MERCGISESLALRMNEVDPSSHGTASAASGHGHGLGTGKQANRQTGCCYGLPAQASRCTVYTSRLCVHCAAQLSQYLKSITAEAAKSDAGSV